MAGLLASGIAAAEPPFGGQASVGYAAELWQALAGRGWVGNNGLRSKPFLGQHPHGAVLDTVAGPLSLRGHSGVVVIKRNYAGQGVSVKAVADDPDRWLRSVTVMYQRERGYDLENNNWFWAKYRTDGRLERNAHGVPLAGRVAKGTAKGCIACHRAAPGGDLVFNSDRYK